MIYELVDTWLNISALWYWNDAYSLTRNRDGTNSWNWCCFRPFFHHFSSLGFPLLGTGFSLAPPPAAEPSFVGPSPNPLAVPWAASIHWVRFIARCCKFHWARFPSVFPLFSHSRNFRTHLISRISSQVLPSVPEPVQSLLGSDVTSELLRMRQAVEAPVYDWN